LANYLGGVPFGPQTSDTIMLFTILKILGGDRSHERISCKLWITMN